MTTMEQQGRGPLSHLRVLDLSRVLAGPFAGQILGDLGADVVKVERPKSGDDTRAWGPPFMPDEQGAPTGESAYFMSCNRNKRSLVVDFGDPEGQRLLRTLAGKADVVIENFKVGGLAQYGLDYPTLHGLRPGLIYCSITGFGQTGPYAPRAGYDFMIQAMAGLMSVTGHPDGMPGGGPMKVGVALVDVMSALYSVIGILAALAHRDRTGEGQHIDVALLDVSIAGLVNQAMNYFATGRSPHRLGNAHPNIVPYQDFPTADGHIVIAVGNDGQFARLCGSMDCPDLALDPRFAGNAARVANRTVLIGLLNAASIKRTTAEWIRILEQAGVPCGPINSLDAVFADPHVCARGTEVRLAHPTAGQVSQVASPLRLSATPVTYRRAPPTLGQHSEEILRDWLAE
jgi:crotonobetainyl-CoA:carnitine CoA-transferase CaiB-like acyl-CoA transferase